MHADDCTEIGREDEGAGDESIRDEITNLIAFISLFSGGSALPCSLLHARHDDGGAGKIEEEQSVSVRK